MSGKRDYSLTGAAAKSAVERGLASAQWYHTEVPRAQMKALMQRSDAPALRDTVIWFAVLIVSAAGGVWFWPALWCVPFWLVYGVMYASASDSRWHECGHGTAFRTQWMNEAVYQIACFMIMRDPVAWRWSHARHHTDTVIVGRDPEIAIMRPVELAKVVLNFFGIPDTISGIRLMLIHAAGSLTDDERDYVPASEQHKVARVARIWLLIYAATAAAALYMGSILPFMVIGGPRLFGSWHYIMTGLLQHGGLADNVLDHRLNSRTVMMNRINRFIYWNMNYHVEHHMFPMVPYHALPQLHELIKHDLPPASPSIFAAYKEMWPAVLRQVRNEDYFLLRQLPATAKPYKAELHDYSPALAAE